MGLHRAGCRVMETPQMSNGLVNQAFPQLKPSAYSCPVCGTRPFANPVNGEPIGTLVIQIQGDTPTMHCGICAARAQRELYPQLVKDADDGSSADGGSNSEA